MLRGSCVPLRRGSSDAFISFFGIVSLFTGPNGIRLDTSYDISRQINRLVLTCDAHIICLCRGSRTAVLDRFRQSSAFAASFSFVHDEQGLLSASIARYLVRVSYLGAALTGAQLPAVAGARSPASSPASPEPTAARAPPNNHNNINHETALSSAVCASVQAGTAALDINTGAEDDEFLLAAFGCVDF